MHARKACYRLFLSAALMSLAGCAAILPDCSPIGLQMSPDSAVANHLAAPPGNSQTFSATFQFSGNPACFSAQDTSQVNSNWTASDPSVRLSSADATEVTATCTAALQSPVTITATPVSGESVTGHATLICN